MSDPSFIYLLDNIKEHMTNNLIGQGNNNIEVNASFIHSFTVKILNQDI